MLEPIVQSLDVPCDQQQAFQVFVHEMGTWWPLHKRAMSIYEGKTATALRVDPRLGGQIVEVSDDGTEHHWGTIRAYDPHGSVALDFHMGMPPENASLVEVRFEALDAGRTRVVLTQSNWEAFGDMAEMMRDGYGSSWSMILGEGYLVACGGEAVASDRVDQCETAAAAESA